MHEKSKFASLLSDFIDIVYLGILWLLCSLPILTAGPAWTALYYTAVKVIRRERGNLNSSFFSAFKRNFKCSFLVWLIYLGAAALWAADLYAVFLMAGSKTSIHYFIVLFLILPVIFTAPWVFAYISRFECNVLSAIKNSAFLAFRNPGRSIVIFILMGMTAFLSWMLPPVSLLLPGFCCLIMTYSIEPVFKKITVSMEDTNIDRWYNE